jgi:anti-sigma factor RsiW
MSSQSLHTDHPVDALPEYVRGDVANKAEIEEHLAGCETCRAEVEVLRLLARPVATPLSDVESVRVYREFESRRIAAGPDLAAPGPPWLRATWRAAAAIALLLTSVGVLRIVQVGSTADWDPQVALDGWAEDLADIELSAGELRVAFGVGPVNGVALDLGWDGLEAVDMGEIEVPWEDGR